MSTHSDTDIGLLRSWILPEDCRWQRACANVRESNKFANFAEEYDTTTFFYDAFGSRGRVLLICPKLLNLEALYRSSRFYCDGVSVKPRLRRYFQYDQVELMITAADTLTVKNECGETTVGLRSTPPEIFSGLNCIVTVNKNNDLAWIQAFVDYHVQQHNAQALLLFDNQSTLYGHEKIEQVLNESRLDAFQVVSAPFSYGPMLRDRSTRCQYLQVALLNAARLFYLQSARAVLSVDIDELVAPSSPNIFDAAQQSALKFVRFKGWWRYAGKDVPARISHGDHIYRALPDISCPHKYCYVPSAPLASLPLDMHGFSIRNSLIRKLMHSSTMMWRGKFWHCSGLTTNWKGARAATIPNIAVDFEMKRILHKPSAGQKR